MVHQTFTRFNLFTSIAVNATPADGYSSGQAIKAAEEVASQVYHKVMAMSSLV